MSERVHYVYVISSIEDGQPVAPCKIGISHSPTARLSTLQTGSHKKLEIIALIPMTQRNLAEVLEQSLHACFEDQKVMGEWFDVNPVDASIGACTLAKELFLQVGLTDEQAHSVLNDLGITKTIKQCFDYLDHCKRRGVDTSSKIGARELHS